jgi:hypothetical protein
MGERDDPVVTAHDSVGAWAKSYYFAVRAAMESVLRPYGLGPAQWHVLYQLANDGPAMQRDLARLLQIERATLSGIVAALVRKGLVDQVPGPADQPDPLAVIRAIAFDGADAADLATARRVLQSATRQLTDHLAEGQRADDPRRRPRP